ncbi:MAG: hypothetical protein M1541_10550 [Acidobacteria bacterium]|nr:hypothetical protein [Acidobacteriota bacterium]
MATKYRKTAPKRKRQRTDHGGVPQLAAQIAGVSVFTVYAVIYGRVKSAHVTRAIKDARQQLRQIRKKAA